MRGDAERGSGGKILVRGDAERGGRDMSQKHVRSHDFSTYADFCRFPQTRSYAAQTVLQRQSQVHRKIAPLSIVFGADTCFLFRLCIGLANTMLISPEQMQQAMDVAMSQYSNLLDSNSMAAMESMMGNFPAISFFSVLIYCFLYGTVLSMILSSDIPSKNPFDRQETDNTDNK